MKGGNLVIAGSLNLSSSFSEAVIMCPMIKEVDAIMFSVGVIC